MANTEKKVTKRESLEAIIEIINASEVENADELAAVIEKIIEQDIKKAAKAKERAAEKKAEGDELREKVATLLTTEFQSAQALTDAIGDAEVTKSKVIARLKQLVDAGIAVKEEQKIGDKKCMAYKLAAAPETADAE